MSHAAQDERGSALIAVLWLVAILGSIVLATGAIVRGETDLVATKLDSTRAYYLAAGAIDRTLLWIHWSPEYRNEPVLHLQFPSGTVDVTIFSENKKSNVNTIQPEALSRLLLTLGASSSDAQAIAGSPRFAPGHDPIGDLEELFAIPGITPDLYYGHFSSEDGEHLVWRRGLRDELTVFQSADVIALRSTARLKDGPVRTVMAIVRLEPAGTEPFFRTLRWYDDAASIGRP
jgi:general secretion pathway protein K